MSSQGRAFIFPNDCLITGGGRRKHAFGILVLFIEFSCSVHHHFIVVVNARINRIIEE